MLNFVVILFILQQLGIVPKHRNFSKHYNYASGLKGQHSTFLFWNKFFFTASFLSTLYLYFRILLNTFFKLIIWPLNCFQEKKICLQYRVIRMHVIEVLKSFQNQSFFQVPRQGQVKMDSIPNTFPMEAHIRFLSSSDQKLLNT